MSRRLFSVVAAVAAASVRDHVGGFDAREHERDLRRDEPRPARGWMYGHEASAGELVRFARKRARARKSGRGRL